MLGFFFVPVVGFFAVLLDFFGPVLGFFGALLLGFLALLVDFFPAVPLGFFADPEPGLVGDVLGPRTPVRPVLETPVRPVRVLDVRPVEVRLVRPVDFRPLEARAVRPADGRLGARPVRPVEARPLLRPERPVEARPVLRPARPDEALPPPRPPREATARPLLRPALAVRPPERRADAERPPERPMLRPPPPRLPPRPASTSGTAIRAMPRTAIIDIFMGIFGLLSPDVANSSLTAAYSLTSENAGCDGRAEIILGENAREEGWRIRITSPQRATCPSTGRTFLRRKQWQHSSTKWGWLDLEPWAAAWC